MASKRLHDAVPAFPQDLRPAPMHTISLKRLTAGETSTCQSILHACQELGFFLLDLQGDEVGEIVIDEVDRLFRAGEDIMNLPEEVKEKFQHDIPRNFLGYELQPRSSVCLAYIHSLALNLEVSLRQKPTSLIVLSGSMWARMACSTMHLCNHYPT